MQHLRTGLVSAIVVLLAAPAAAVAGSSPDTWFYVRANASGNFEADFGDDTRYKKNGKYTVAWRWSTQHVVRFAAGRASGFDPGPSVSRWFYDETSTLTYDPRAPLPGASIAPRTAVTTARGGRRDISECEGGRSQALSWELDGDSPESRVGDWVRAGYIGFGRRFSPETLAIGPDPYEPFRCSGGDSGFHTRDRHGLDGATGYPELEVPRGAFNPRSDRKWKEKFSDTVAFARDEEHSGTRDPHSVAGKSKVTVKVKRLSAYEARVRARSFRRNYRDPCAC